MTIQIYSKEDQAYGAFNGGEIIENKPIGFPIEGGKLKQYSNMIYWANAIAKVDSTIGLHPHKGFEIMSFVLEGKIKHFDTKLNAWKELSEGDVQIIRAGNGISHSEFMAEGSRMFQIWLDPNLQKTLTQEATYDDYQKAQFPTKVDGSAQVTTLIGEGSPLALEAEGVSTHRIKITQSPYVHTLSKDKAVGVYILSGSFKLNDQEAQEDEFIMINEADEISFEGVGEIFVFSTPSKLSYQSYIESMQ